MTQTIYLDVYFCLNFLMDFMILLMTGMGIKSRKPTFRLALAAGIGALYATVVLVMEWGTVWMKMITYAGVAPVMCLVSFGRPTPGGLVKSIAVLYAVTFVTCGAVNAAYYGTDWGKNLMLQAQTQTFGRIPFCLLLSVGIVLVTGGQAVAECIRRGMRQSAHLYEVAICQGDAKIAVTALCDTGNSLVEPLTKKTVSILEQTCMQSFDTTTLRYFMVPYHAVGTSQGLMTAFLADELRVGGKTVHNAMIGIYQGTLSQKKHYQMILHPDIFDEGEKE